MDLQTLSKVCASGQKVEVFLRERGILKFLTECPYCGNPHFGKVRRNSFKCFKGKRDWIEFWRLLRVE